MQGWKGLMLTIAFIEIFSFPRWSLSETNKILTFFGIFKIIPLIILDPNKTVFITAEILKGLDLSLDFT